MDKKTNNEESKMTMEQANIFCLVLTGMNMKDFVFKMLDDLNKNKKNLDN